MNFDSEIINKEDFKIISNNFFSLTSLKVLTYILPLITFPFSPLSPVTLRVSIIPVAN